MKLQYVPHGNSPVGYLGPIVDLHDRWLVPPRLTSPDAPDVALVIKPGDFIDLHEIRDRHALEFMRAHRDFRMVNASHHPESIVGGGPYRIEKAR